MPEKVSAQSRRTAGRRYAARTAISLRRIVQTPLRGKVRSQVRHPSKIMKLPKFVSITLIAVALASPIVSADSTTDAEEQERREYLELQRKSTATYERDSQISRVIGVLFLGGLVGLVISYRRFVGRALGIAELQQKTLEEIRDLLRKQ